GLLNQIVPAAKLREAAVEMAQMVAKNDSRMVRGIKRLLHEGMGLDWQGRYDLEDEARAAYLAAGHPRDGFKDFLARKPVRSWAMDAWLAAALDYLPRWLEFQLRHSEQPGCVVAAAVGGEIVLEKAFGLANLASGEKL